MKKNPWRFLSAGAVALMLAAPLNFPVSAAGGDVLVTPFTGVEIENSALNVSAEKVQPLGNGLDGSKITIQADLDPIDNKNFVFPGHHNDRAKVITGKGAIAGSTGLVVYVEMPTANKFCFFANINSPHDDRWNNDFDTDIMQTVDSAYRLLPVGGSRWEDCKAGKGKISDDVGYGCVEFDEAFKGWVYIPWDSLWVDIGFELDISKDTLHAVTMYPTKGGWGRRLSDLWPSVSGDCKRRDPPDRRRRYHARYYDNSPTDYDSTSRSHHDLHDSFYRGIDNGINNGFYGVFCNNLPRR